MKRKRQEKADEERRENTRKETIKRQRLEKQRVLEKKWEMLRWITTFIDENQEKWLKEGRERMDKREQELGEWDRTSRFNKIKFLKKKHQNKHSEE